MTFGHFLVFAVCLVLPGAARAAGGEETTVATLVWQGINLILLIAVLVYFARKPVVDFFRGRHEQVKGDLDAAASVLSDAQGRLAEWQARADRLDAEVERIKEIARERAVAEREHILSDAQASAERIRSDATAAVSQEVERARAELRAEAAELATRLAGDLLRQNVGEDDQQRLVDEFVERLAASDAGRAH